MASHSNIKLLKGITNSNLKHYIRKYIVQNTEDFLSEDVADFPILPPVDQWDLSNVTDMSNLFNGVSTASDNVVIDIIGDGEFVLNQNLVNNTIYNTDNEGDYEDTITESVHLNTLLYYYIPELIEYTNYKDIRRFMNVIENEEDIFSQERSVSMHRKVKFLINKVINKLDVSKVVNMKNMFCGNKFLTKDLDLRHWNVSNVENMENMFRDSSLQTSINEWGEKTKNVTSMKGMFRHTKELTHHFKLDKWNVSNVTTMEDMFRLSSFNSPLNAWHNDIKKVTNMSKMFFCAYYFNQPLDKWRVKHVKNLDKMFPVHYTQDLSDWMLSDDAIIHQKEGERIIYVNGEVYKNNNVVTPVDVVLTHNQLLRDLSVINADNYILDFFNNPKKIALFPRNMKLEKIPIYQKNPQFIEIYEKRIFKNKAKTLRLLSEVKVMTNPNTPANRALSMKQPNIRKEIAAYLGGKKTRKNKQIRKTRKNKINL